jgi:hypothetical protein
MTLSITGCVMYCLTMVACGEGVESIVALCRVLVPGSFDTAWNGSPTAVTAAATCALGGVLTVCAGAWWMPNRERIAAIAVASSAFI